MTRPCPNCGDVMDWQQIEVIEFDLYEITWECMECGEQLVVTANEAAAR